MSSSYSSTLNSPTNDTCAVNLLARTNGSYITFPVGYLHVLTTSHVYFAVCILFQYLSKHGRLPEFERFLAIEPVGEIVAPIYRSRDMLPNWFSMFEEITTNVRLPPQLRQTRVSASARPDKLSKPDLAPSVAFDSTKVDNTRTVLSILTESANVARAATSSIVPTDRQQLLSSTITATVSRVTGAVVSNTPTSDVTLQRSLNSDLYHPVDVVTSATVAPSDVLIITADQLQQLCFDTSILPMVTTCNNSQLDTSLIHSDNSEVPGNHNGSVPLLSSVSSLAVPASDNTNQPAATAITKSPNLIGQAFASAVGISVDQLSSFADDDQWNVQVPTSNDATDTETSVPGDVTCGISSNNVTVVSLEQAVTTAVPNVNISSTHLDDLSPTTGPDSRNIFGRCDVDVSELDIMMFNSSLSPSLPSEPCDHHVNNDSTLATPKKVERNRDDEILTFAGAKICASDEATLSPCASAVFSDSQYPVSCNYSEVGISRVTSALSGSLISSVLTSAVSSAAVMSTVSGSASVPSINAVPVPSPAHGMALLSFTSPQMSAESGSNDITPSTMVSLASSTPVPDGPHAMFSPFQQTKHIPIPMHHTRSPSKYVLSNRRPILPRNEQPGPSSKSDTSSFLSKRKPRKSAAKDRLTRLPAIAPKAVVAKSYLSPVKQAAASIKARAKRLQNSPSLSPVIWTLANDDDDEAASGEGEEQNTDIDSQLEDDFEDDSFIPSAEQSPSSYVKFLARF